MAPTKFYDPSRRYEARMENTTPLVWDTLEDRIDSFPATMQEAVATADRRNSAHNAQRAKRRLFAVRETGRFYVRTRERGCTFPGAAYVVDRKGGRVVRRFASLSDDMPERIEKAQAYAASRNRLVVREYVASTGRGWRVDARYVVRRPDGQITGQFDRRGEAMRHMQDCDRKDAGAGKGR